MDHRSRNQVRSTDDDIVVDEFVIQLARSLLDQWVDDVANDGLGNKVGRQGDDEDDDDGTGHAEEIGELGLDLQALKPLADGFRAHG